VRYLSIPNSVVSAESLVGDAIGGVEDQDSCVQDLVIFDCTISAGASLGAAIAASHDLTLGGRLDLDVIDALILANSIQITANASITAHVSSGPLFSPAPSADGAFELVIVFDEPTGRISDNLPSSQSTKYLQIGKVVNLSKNGTWNISASSSSYSHYFSFNSTRSQSFVVSVNCNDTYSLLADLDSLSGKLESDGQSSFTVFDSVFLPNASFVQLVPATATRSPLHTALPSETATAGVTAAKTKSQSRLASPSLRITQTSLSASSAIATDSPASTVIPPTFTPASRSNTPNPSTSPNASPIASQSTLATQSASSSPSRSRTPTSPDQKGLSAGAIVGISLGGVGIVALVIVVFFVCGKRSRRADLETLNSTLLSKDVDSPV
jgi:hypothetical protein